MPTATLTFANPINVSIQENVLDIVFYQTAGTTTVTRMGECQAIDRVNNTLTCFIDNTTALPAVGDFIFFAKDNIVNTSGIIGYHATVKMSVTSTAERELYAVSSETFISS
jgi:hypothetical protein